MEEICSYAYALEDVFGFYANDMRRGWFVDIGCGHPEVGSNSLLLEELGWHGLALDAREYLDWPHRRSTTHHRCDVTCINLEELLIHAAAPPVIELLSIDVDDDSFLALKNVPFDRWSFRVILVEHDLYRTPSLVGPQRALLASRGYDLVCANVHHEPGKPFEDWWLHPTHVSANLRDQLRCEDELDINVIRRFGYGRRILRKHGIYGSYPRIEVT